MSDIDDIQRWLDENFAELAERHGVPGASAAVLADDRVATASAGVVNLATGVPVTDDAVFQIGSITKIWTTTLVMQLVAEGAVDLDAPVRRYLPEFVLADEAAGRTITVRQLLTHTGGFQGDLFVDTGKGDDAVARLITDVLPEADQPLPPGAMFSYNNAGFIVLGRIVEVLRGVEWGRAVRERIAEPLGLTHVSLDADDAVRHRAAIGHLTDAAGATVPSRVWGLPRSNGPAGAVLGMTAGELIAFAAMHLRDGITADGTVLLDPVAARQMRVPQVDQPCCGLRPPRQGLGWAVYDWPGGPVVGHNGNTIGQSAYLRLVPGRGVAVALLTNGGRTDRLAQDLLSHTLSELADVTVPPALEVPEPSPVAEPERYAGTYRGGLGEYTVTVDGDRLRLTVVDLARFGGLDAEPTVEYDLRRADGELFVSVNADGELASVFRFVFDDSGRVVFLHNHRALPRVA